MRCARLLGHEHHALDAVAAVAEGPAAIAICRGGAEKTYRYTDPNEDAVCYAIGPGGLFAAVADGHGGARGAERAIEWVLEHLAEAWTATRAPHRDADSWAAAAAGALQRIHRALIEQDESLRMTPAPTTLSMALVRHDQERIVHASVGDSHVFRVSLEGESFTARDLGWATSGKRGSHFLGEPNEGGVLAERQWVIGCEPTPRTAALLLASDGLSERGVGVPDPEASAAEAAALAAEVDPDLRPLEVCKHLTEAALEAQREQGAGDNVSAAVLWLRQ